MPASTLRNPPEEETVSAENSPLLSSHRDGQSSMPTKRALVSNSLFGGPRPLATQVCILVHMSVASCLLVAIGVMLIGLRLLYFPPLPSLCLGRMPNVARPSDGGNFTQPSRFVELA